MKLFRVVFAASILFIIFTPFSNKIYAATLTSAKDTITTSRPSASSPLSADAASSATQVSIYDNSSRYLASDSAKLIKTATGALVDTSILIASQSAALTTVYFGDTLGAAGAGGADVLFAPITAMHTIRFTIVNAIPDEGDLEIYFPTLTSGDADNDASPSATTFQFNNLVTGAGGVDNIEVYDDSSSVTSAVTVTETEPSAGTAGRLTIEFDTGPIAAGSVITVMLGCSAASDENTCTTQVPRIINPTKTAAAGTADNWKVKIDTEDASNLPLDTATVTIGTIESVQVYATVDPTLTFTIAGVDDADHILPINTGNTTGCTNTEDTSAGIAATATVINLGILNTASINISAQLITVSTNGGGGYSLTATSSGHLINQGTGFWIADDNTLPGTALTAGTPQFGIHACGLDINGTNWGTGATGGGINALYAWPMSTALTIASDSTGPVGNSITAGNGLTSVEYAGTIDISIPAGTYQSYVTYVATPAF